MTTLTPGEVQDLWADKLESGEYKQCRRNLRVGRGDQMAYCCLGVLTDLAVQHGLLARFRGKNALPYKKVADWAGLGTTKGSTVDGPSLATLNDQGQSFAEIAKVIRKRPKGLFVATSEEQS